MNEEESPVEAPPTLEAFPAHERVKSDILNVQAAVDMSLFNYNKAVRRRGKRNKSRLPDNTALEFWADFQTCLLLLYKKLKPHLKNVKVSPEMAIKLQHLEHYFIDPVKCKKLLRDAEWKEIAFFLDESVYQIGVSKIELDKTKIDEFI